MKDIDDRGYTKLFSNKEIFRQLVTSFVQEEWVKDLDFSNCELVPGVFVSENYEKTFSDLMYKVKLRDRDFYIVILLEFKSAPALFVVVQVLGYILDFYRHVVFGGSAYDFELLASQLLALFDRTEDKQAISLFLNWLKQMAIYERIDESHYREFERIYYERTEVNMLENAIREEKKQIREQGWMDGKSEGKVEGKMEGKVEGRLEVAKMMLQNGEPVEKIKLYTGLPEEQIRELQKELQKH